MQSCELSNSRAVQVRCHGCAVGSLGASHSADLAMLNQVHLECMVPDGSGYTVRSRAVGSGKREVEVCRRTLPSNLVSAHFSGSRHGQNRPGTPTAALLPAGVLMTLAVIAAHNRPGLGRVRCALHRVLARDGAMGSRGGMVSAAARTRSGLAPCRGVPGGFPISPEAPRPHTLHGPRRR